MSLLAAPSTWNAILEEIRSRITPHQFSTWFQNLQASSNGDAEINIRVPNLFFKDWLAENYVAIIREAMQEVTGTTATIRFVIDETIRLNEHQPEERHVSLDTPPPRPLGLPINDHYTFDSFVVGPSNQLAHAAAVAVSGSPGTTYNPLFMYGSVGLGKSHLLQAICHAGLKNNPRTKIAYLSCETFVNEFISALQRNDLPTFRDLHRQLDILLIDDIQFLSRGERSQEEFFHTFNDLYNARRQIVISCDQPPQEIAGLQERLLSRFKSGLIARVDAPSYETRIAILQRKAQLRNVALPSDVIEYIASTISTNIRELGGAIIKVVGYASLLNQPITLDVARTALHVPPGAKPQISIEDILRVVTKQFAVRVADLQSKRRTRSIVLPRQVCMYLGRTLTRMSLEEIGGYFGGRDHSTVLHATDKIRSQIPLDTALANTIEKLKTDLSMPHLD